MSELIFSEIDRPFDECHASTLVRFNDGRFLIAFFAGSKEGEDDVAIYQVEGEAGRWAPPRQIAKVADVPHWNPVLHLAEDGRIHLFFKVGKSPEKWGTWRMVSDDEGAHWSTPSELVSGDVGGRGPVKNKLIVLSDGTWLAGASLETGGNWDAFADRSKDGGETWRASALIPLDRDLISGAGVIQPTLWESASGKVHMLLRSSCGRICRSDSADDGRTWSPIYKTALPNNNSGIDLVKMPTGELVLCYNPVPGDWAARSPLSLAVSLNNGESWRRVKDLETEEGEFSYPAVISVAGGVAVSYTWKRRCIAFFQSDLKDLGGPAGLAGT